MKQTTLLRITGKRSGKPFVAGIEFNTDGFCVRAAPILKFMRSMSRYHIEQICENHRWTIEEVRRHVPTQGIYDDRQTIGLLLERFG